MSYANQVEKIEVIRTTLLTRGKGVEGDPIRRITQYWSLDGDLLAEVDEWLAAEKVREQMQRNKDTLARGK